VASLIYKPFLLLCRSFLISCSAIFQSFFLAAEPTAFFWGIPAYAYCFQCIPCTSFKVLGLILRSLIHFELRLVQGERQRASFNFLQADIQFSQQHSLKRLSFVHCMFLAPLSKIRWA
jgi:hypothetical protein